MKKNLLALAVLAASGTAFAQSNVTVYGLADVWFGNTSGTGVTSQTRVDSGGLNTSRWGLKGSEDLGGGLKLNFLLEQGFALDTGAATPGQAFSRQSYLGFSGNFGEVRIGKIWTAFDDISGAASGAFDANALKPTAGVWLTNDYQGNPGNTLYYASRNYSGFKGAFSYSLDENNSVNNPRVSSLNVQYAAGPLYAGLAYQTEQTSGLADSKDFTRLNGTYNFGMAKLLAGYGRFSGLNGVSANEWELGAEVPLSPVLTLSGGFAASDSNAKGGDASRKGYSLAAAYSLSKRTTLYGGFHSATTSEPAKADLTNRATAVGVRHTF